MKEIILSKEFVSLSISISSPSFFIEARPDQNNPSNLHLEQNYVFGCL